MSEVKNVSRKVDRMLLLMEEGRVKDRSARTTPCLPPGFQFPLHEQGDLEQLNCLLEEQDSSHKMVVYYAGTSHTSNTSHPIPTSHSWFMLTQI